MADSIFTSMSGTPPVKITPPRNRLEPEYNDAYQAWKLDRSPASASALISSVQPILTQASRHYGDSPNIRTKAKHIALQAMHSYDPARASLRTHLMTHLQGLRRYAGQQELPIKVPERVVLQHKAMRDASEEFQDEFGYEPSDAELSERTGLSPKRLVELRKWRRPLSEGRMTATEAYGEEEEPADPAITQDIPVDVLHEFIYNDLHPRDQLIMDYALGRNGRERLPANLIAQRVGVTPGSVSQRLAHIQRKLDTAQDLNLFGE